MKTSLLIVHGETRFLSSSQSLLLVDFLIFAFGRVLFLLAFIWTAIIIVVLVDVIIFIIIASRITRVSKKIIVTESFFIASINL